MIDFEIEYPEGTETTQEQREYDSFLLSHISAEARRLRSPTIRLEPEKVEAAWQEHKRTRSNTH